MKKGDSSHQTKHKKMNNNIERETSTSDMDPYEAAFQLQLQEAIEASQLSFQADEQFNKSDFEVGRYELKCKICFETMDSDFFIVLSNCPHEFCIECLQKYASAKVSERVFPIVCPDTDCGQALSNEECNDLLDSKSYAQFSTMLVENSISDSDKVYCPFKDCSALMLADSFDEFEELESEIGVRSVECLEYHRLFCFECRVPWHSDLSCSEYQNLPADMKSFEDQKFHLLAKERKWKRCRQCLRMVEHSSGCTHMTCRLLHYTFFFIMLLSFFWHRVLRCGHHFCYVCGGDWKHSHVCQTK